MSDFPGMLKSWIRNRRKRLILALTGVFVAFIAILVATTPRHSVDQPVYKGLTLAQWLDIVVRHRINGYAPLSSSQGLQPAKDATPEQVHEAEEAVRAIGTNALPHLMAWINPKPNPFKRFYRGVLDLLPLPDHTRGFLWGLPGTKDDTLAQFGVEGFRLLNTNALPVLANLSKMANTQTIAAKALRSVTNTTPQ